MFTAAVVVEGCAPKGSLPTAFRGWRVGICLLVSFVLPRGEKDSPSPIIGDGFLDPYNVDYVGQPLNH